MSKLKALFHIDEAEKWQLVLNNINNFIKDQGSENIDVHVVANAKAVIGYKKSTQNACTADSCSCGNSPTGNLLEQMQTLAQSNVQFFACANALRGQNIAENQVPEFVTVVPAGITAIVTKQGEGFAYLRP